MVSDLVDVTDGETTIKGVYKHAISDLEKILADRVSIAGFEFSTVLEAVLMVTRPEHIAKLEKRKSPALGVILDMPGWLGDETNT